MFIIIYMGWSVCCGAAMQPSGWRHESSHESGETDTQPAEAVRSGTEKSPAARVRGFQSVLENGPTTILVISLLTQAHLVFQLFQPFCVCLLEEPHCGGSILRPRLALGGWSAVTWCGCRAVGRSYCRVNCLCCHSVLCQDLDSKEKPAAKCWNESVQRMWKPCGCHLLRAVFLLIVLNLGTATGTDNSGEYFVPLGLANHAFLVLPGADVYVGGP